MRPKKWSLLENLRPGNRTQCNFRFFNCPRRTSTCNHVHHDLKFSNKTENIEVKENMLETFTDALNFAFQLVYYFQRTVDNFCNFCIEIFFLHSITTKNWLLLFCLSITRFILYGNNWVSKDLTAFQIVIAKSVLNWEFPTCLVFFCINNRVFHSPRSANFVYIYGTTVNKKYVYLVELISKYHYYFWCICGCFCKCGMVCMYNSNDILKINS